MVRLLAIFAPAYALLAAIGIVSILKPFFTLLKEAPRIVVKTKRGIARVSKEYSGVAIFLIFIIVLSNVAFMPQNSGVPRVYGSAYVPIAISAGSLPLGGSDLRVPVAEWTDMLKYTDTELNSTDVVASWWDYGYWLGIIGNVTTLADNATVNATQIENVGYIMMANETQSLKMAKLYDAKYILVFVTLQVRQVAENSFTATFGAWGDEAKWYWMARISGGANPRLTREGFMDNQTGWVDETAFGGADTQTGQFVWNDKGTNSTIYKLMSYAKDIWGTQVGQSASIVTDISGIVPTYFKQKYIAGLTPSSLSYSGIVPLVALYEIDWEKYNADFNITG
jgi:dolichyl-diphosphooligosaccharide--protein glycosyltransferase